MCGLSFGFNPDVKHKALAASRACWLSTNLKKKKRGTLVLALSVYTRPYAAFGVLVVNILFLGAYGLMCICKNVGLQSGL